MNRVRFGGVGACAPLHPIPDSIRKLALGRWCCAAKLLLRTRPGGPIEGAPNLPNARHASSFGGVRSYSRRRTTCARWVGLRHRSSCRGARSATTGSAAEHAATPGRCHREYRTRLVESGRQPRARRPPRPDHKEQPRAGLVCKAVHDWCGARNLAATPTKEHTMGLAAESQGARPATGRPAPRLVLTAAALSFGRR